MDKQIGNFKYSIRPYKDGYEQDVFQFIVMSLQDPLFNEWRIEAMDIEATEEQAEGTAIEIITFLAASEMLVEE